jgi:hypothetical protein
MTDAEFWALIDTSRLRAKGSPRRQKGALEQGLRTQTPDDIAEFNVRYTNLIRKAYHWDLWGAAYIIGQGCSDDGFWDFRSWLVSRGKRVYQAALRNPESLVRLIGEKERDRSWKSFHMPAPSVWAELAERPMEECPGLPGNLGEEPAGEAWAEYELPTRFPRLWKRFGKQPGER